MKKSVFLTIVFFSLMLIVLASSFTHLGFGSITTTKKAHPKAGQPAKELPPSAYVNPFIGASTSIAGAGVHGLGKTFPGATTPFGMVQVSPNTITGGDNGPGYSYEHQTIEGFAFTQMSGVGWGTLELFMRKEPLH